MAITAPVGITSSVRPATSGAYLAASALHNAGFRGWALTIMTAIAGRESNWIPNRVNNDPSTGDYSVGLTQINYYGDLLSSRTASFGSPSSLSANPQAQANATFALAGGNSLSGLSNWALSPSPAAGVVPTPTATKYSILPYLAQAYVAASLVGSEGPAPASAIANENAWPKTNALTPAQISSLPSDIAYAGASGSASGSAGCSSLGNVFSGTSIIGVSILPTFTRCQAKALLGGLAIAGGGALMVTGLALIVVTGVTGKNPVRQQAQKILSRSGTKAPTATPREEQPAEPEAQPEAPA